MNNITKRFVDSLRPSRDEVHWDSNLKRFGLRVAPSGLMTYVVQYVNQAGRSRRMTIGIARRGSSSDDSRIWTAEEARRQAQALLFEADQGRDPLDMKRSRRADISVANLVDLYLAEGPADKPGKKVSSWTTDASNLKRHVVPLLGSHPLKSLTKADIQRFQRDVTAGKSRADEKTRKRGRAIVKGGAGTAARATIVLAAMLSWAVERSFIQESPAKGVKLNKLRNRERFLSTLELAALGDALAKCEGQGVNSSSLAALKLLILTGARKSEITTLRWAYVDWDASVLRLPDSKTGAKVIPLGAPALQVLAALRGADATDYVFPATRGNGHNEGLAPIWRKVTQAAGLSDVRIHDLRHAFASVAAASGSSLYVIGKMLGHTQAATTARYSHLAIDPILQAADQTARRISDALEAGTKTLNIVEIRRAAAAV